MSEVAKVEGSSYLALKGHVPPKYNFHFSLIVNSCLTHASKRNYGQTPLAFL